MCLWNPECWSDYTLIIMLSWYYATHIWIACWITWLVNYLELVSWYYEIYVHIRTCCIHVHMWIGIEVHNMYFKFHTNNHSIGTFFRRGTTILTLSSPYLNFITTVAIAHLPAILFTGMNEAEVYTWIKSIWADDYSGVKVVSWVLHVPTNPGKDMWNRWCFVIFN